MGFGVFFCLSYFTVFTENSCYLTIIKLTNSIRIQLNFSYYESIKEMFMKNQKTSLCKSYIFLVNTISLLLISFFWQSEFDPNLRK